MGSIDTFFKYWFRGLENGLLKLDQEARQRIFAECGKACSDSCTREIYQKLWELTGNFHDFFVRLDEDNEEIFVKEIEENRSYEISYRKCLCDLYVQGYLSTGHLCECSRQSLIYNLSTIANEHVIDVERKESILNGGKECKFVISIFD